MTPFAARHPALYHVTWRSAVESIRTEGLLSARRLCERHTGVPVYMLSRSSSA